MEIKHRPDRVAHRPSILGFSGPKSFMFTGALRIDDHLRNQKTNTAGVTLSSACNEPLLGYFQRLVCEFLKFGNVAYVMNR
jgi:hypothetical protein